MNTEPRSVSDSAPRTGPEGRPDGRPPRGGAAAEPVRHQRFIERDLTDEGGRSVRAAALCALAMAAAIWYLSRLSPEARHQSIVMLVPAITAAFGPFFLVAGIRAGLRLHKFGRSTVEIEPPVQGAPLRGTIRSQRRVDAIGRYAIRLRCEDVQGRAVATTLFKGSCHVPHGRINSMDGIPFEIEPTNDDMTPGFLDRMTAERVRWWVEVWAPTEFISYNAIFDISHLLRRTAFHDSQPWWLQVDPEVPAPPSPRR